MRARALRPLVCVLSLALLSNVCSLDVDYTAVRSREALIVEIEERECAERSVQGACGPFSSPLDVDADYISGRPEVNRTLVWTRFELQGQSSGAWSFVVAGPSCMCTAHSRRRMQLSVKRWRNFGRRGRGSARRPRSSMTSSWLT